MKKFLLFTVLIGIAVWQLGYWGIASYPLDLEPKENSVRVACVGDSITYGMGVKNWYKNSYPKVLGQLLGAGYDVRNFGVSGRTAMATGDNPYVETGRYQASLDFQPNIVVVMFGTNDSKPQNWQGEAEFFAQFKNLIASYQALPSKPSILLMAPPAVFKDDPTAPDKFGISKVVLVDVREAVRHLAKELGLPVIPMDILSASHREWFIGDGIHPNTAGAAGIATAVYGELL